MTAFFKYWGVSGIVPALPACWDQPLSKRYNPIAAVSSLMPLVMPGLTRIPICITYPAYLYISAAPFHSLWLPEILWQWPLQCMLQWL